MRESGLQGVVRGRRMKTTMADDSKECGWKMKAEDNYDEHYYRGWMHELPPMQHNVRGTLL